MALLPIAPARGVLPGAFGSYTTMSAITGKVTSENTVVRNVPRDMVRVSPS